MAAGELRLIRRRIRSVQSTMKITRAMELIAASRIVKAEQRVQASRPYGERMAAVLGNLAAAAGGNVQHPLLEAREDVERSAVLVLCSDRGLCGAYNTNIFRLALRHIDGMDGGAHEVLALGKKAEGFFSYRGYDVSRTWEMTDQPSYARAKEVAQHAMRRYLDGELDRIDLVYTRFHSAFRQEVVAEPLLPIDPGALAEEEAARTEGTGPAVAPDTIFEPEPAVILGALVPNGVTSRIYSAALEASASEHASRRRAMKAATDNASDLIKALQLEGNKARQAAITTEILEVVGGAEALAAD
ncbi:MAG: F0F1 ATP synthase subunit gamma [Acidimicrobiia bacterium]|nr:F0F1 ATP synthase subunit gamma [Acidimicrobiia bacterium]